MSSTPPPYTTLPSDVPPPYTPAPLTEAQSDSQPSTNEYTPAPAILNQEVVYTYCPLFICTYLRGQTLQIDVASFPRVADHLIFTVISMVVCGLLLNVFAFICLIPAFSLSRKAAKARNRGQYAEARSKAQWSLWLNVTALISYIVLMMLAIGVVLAAVLT